MRRGLPLLLCLAFASGCGGDSGDADDARAPKPKAKPAISVETLELDSRYVDEPLEPLVMVPRARREGAALLVLLHGQGGSPESYMSPQLVAALENLGELAPVVLLPDGGEASYWHDRKTGQWARMVLEELIPAAARKYGADATLASVGGVSMGGFGALHLSMEREFCSVSAHSPALFRTRPKRGSPFAEAFDDEGDFRRADPIRRADELQRGIWVDIGDRDGFAPATRDLVERLRAPRFRVWRGGHDFRFWVRETPTWLRFHVERLERC